MKRDQFLKNACSTLTLFDDEFRSTSILDIAVIDELNFLELPLAPNRSFLHNWHVINEEFKSILSSVKDSLKSKEIAVEVNLLDERLDKVQVDWDMLNFAYGLTEDEDEIITKAISRARSNAKEHGVVGRTGFLSCAAMMGDIFDESLDYLDNPRWEAVLRSVERSIAEGLMFLIAEQALNMHVSMDLSRLLLLRTALERLRLKAAAEGRNSVERFIHNTFGNRP